MYAYNVMFHACFSTNWESDELHSYSCTAMCWIIYSITLMACSSFLLHLLLMTPVLSMTSVPPCIGHLHFSNFATQKCLMQGGKRLR